MNIGYVEELEGPLIFLGVHGNVGPGGMQYVFNRRLILQGGHATALVSRKRARPPRSAKLNGRIYAGGGETGLQDGSTKSRQTLAEHTQFFGRQRPDMKSEVSRVDGGNVHVKSDMRRDSSQDSARMDGDKR